MGDQGRSAVSAAVHKHRYTLECCWLSAYVIEKLLILKIILKLGLSKEHTHLFLFFASFRLMVLNLPNIATL